jgi:hypothetical protein
MRKMSCALWKVQVCPSLVGDDTVMCAGDNEFYKWEYDPLLHTHPDEGLEGEPGEEAELDDEEARRKAEAEAEAVAEPGAGAEDEAEAEAELEAEAEAAEPETEPEAEAEAEAKPKAPPSQSPRAQRAIRRGGD